MSQPKMLYRDTKNAVLGGVCAGIAEYFKIDISTVRILTALGGVVAFGQIFVLYIILWVFLPTETTVEHADQKRVWANIIVAIVVLHFLLPALFFIGASTFMAANAPFNMPMNWLGNY